MYVFHDLSRTLWFIALENLQNALATRGSVAALATYTSLFTALSESGSADLEHAIVRDLLYSDSSLVNAALSSNEIPAGLLEGARCDLDELLTLVKTRLAQRGL